MFINMNVLIAAFVLFEDASWMKMKMAVSEHIAKCKSGGSMKE